MNPNLIISESTLRAIFNDAVDGMIVIDERGIIQTTNPAVSKLFQYSDKEMTGNNISMLMPEPDKSNHDKYLEHHNKTGERKIIGIGREVYGRRKDGSLFPFFLSVSEVFLDDGKRIFAGVLRDISDLKKAQFELEEYMRNLEQANKDLEEFAYISSHDLQEPLRKVQAFADRLQKSDDTLLSEEGKDYLQRIINASNRMQRLINDLLELSRISSKGGKTTPTSLNKVIKDVLEDLELLISRNQATINCDDLPVVLADDTQMRQLFQNLISNAIKFKRDDVAPVINISIDKDAAARETYPFHIIAISDNGIGIEEKYTHKVFTIFQRLHGAKYEGSGIGLAVCKKIVTRLGGKITLSSIPGEGTTFYIQLKKSNL
ncbi:MAG: PAS domain S-box protein [Bacteroidia bacterium]|jgi:two-component system, LuxR family, sensor kinase FixL|nr:PAS domain S-box protein [Bacteroidia bacterium]